MSKLLKDAIFEELKLVLSKDDYIDWEDYKITDYIKQLYSEIESVKNWACLDENDWSRFRAICHLLNLEVKEPYEAPTVESIIKMHT